MGREGNGECEQLFIRDDFFKILNKRTVNKVNYRIDKL